MDSFEKVRRCGRCAYEKKAREVVVLELKGLTDIADYFLIGSGTNERHVRTISEYIEKSLKDMGIKPYSTEGSSDGRWVVLDYRDVVVHIFLEPLRELYDLESLWLEATRHEIEKEDKKEELEGVDDGKGKG